MVQLSHWSLFSGLHQTPRDTVRLLNYVKSQITRIWVDYSCFIALQSQGTSNYVGQCGRSVSFGMGEPGAAGGGWGTLGEPVLSLLPCSELWDTSCCTPASPGRSVQSHGERAKPVLLSSSASCRDSPEVFVFCCISP